MTAYVDVTGRTIAIGQLIGKGGQAPVYAVAGDGTLAVKLPNRIDADYPAKLRAMCDPRYGRLKEFAAWPLSTVHRGVGGPIVGFTMRRVQDHEQVYRLCNGKERLQAFPDVRWDFLVHVAGNVAALVDELHRSDVIVGDLNHQNLFICPKKGTVTLIDCDSMQIIVDGRVFHCGVQFEEYLAPELHGVDLGKTTRTPSQDAFALAILIFQLLMFGRHPFAGKYNGPGKYPSDNLAELIRRGLYAYGPNASRRHMTPPPNLISADLLTDRIWALFERAFTTRDRRPGASEWHTALNWLKGTLKACNVDRQHIYPRDLAGCPFCAFERLPNGYPLFIARTVQRQPPPLPPDAFDIAAFERHIAAIQGPGPAPPLPRLTLMQPSLEAVAAAAQLKSFRRWGRVRAWAGWAVFVAFAAVAVVTQLPLLFFAGIGAGLWTGLGSWPFAARGDVSETVAPFRQREREASRHLDTVRQQWYREASEDRFIAALDLIKQAIADWRKQPQERQRRLDRLRQKLRESQERKFLARFRIEDAEIRGIGRGRRIMLASYGIDTAADITPQSVAAVPGFGPVLTRLIIDWQTQIKRRFVFDPTAPIDPGEVAKVEAEIARQRKALEEQLRRLASELPRIAQQILQARAVLRPKIDAALTQQAQAMEDVRCLDRVFS